MITLITIYDKNFKRVKTFSCRPYYGNEEFDYEYYTSEDIMLREFIRYWKTLNLDIYSGWRCRLFDIPYLCVRISKILGEEFVNELSPFGVVRQREEKSEWDEEETNIYFDIYGIAGLDLMELYKKFVLKKEETYKLDHISTVVLGVGKLEMPYASFRDNYQKAWDTHFVKYNRIDVIRCVEIDDKLNLINLAFTLAQVMRSNLEDVFSPVRYWENLLVSTLFFDKKLVCIDGEKGPSYPYEGGYVMTPKPGLYKWACSVDATSEYPSIMMASNLSTETFVGMFKAAHFNEWAIANGYGPVDENTKINVELVLKQGISGLGEYLKSMNYAMLANGAMFRKDELGFIARETEKVFDGRKVAKKEMLKYKDLKTQIKNELKKRGVTV
jgi:DNA polymerase elongation subunit (family B)